MPEYAAIGLVAGVPGLRLSSGFGLGLGWFRV